LTSATYIIVMLISPCRFTWPTGPSRSTRSRRYPRRTGCYRFSRPAGASRCTWWVTFVVDQLFIKTVGHFGLSILLDIWVTFIAKLVM